MMNLISIVLAVAVVTFLRKDNKRWELENDFIENELYDTK